jgi:hypothetical protein
MPRNPELDENALREAKNRTIDRSTLHDLARKEAFLAKNTTFLILTIGTYCESPYLCTRLTTRKQCSLKTCSNSSVG